MGHECLTPDEILPASIDFELHETSTKVPHRRIEVDISARFAWVPIVLLAVDYSTPSRSWWSRIVHVEHKKL